MDIAAIKAKDAPVLIISNAFVLSHYGSAFGSQHVLYYDGPQPHGQQNQNVPVVLLGDPGPRTRHDLDWVTEQGAYPKVGRAF